jgi:SWI/SNF-related matrix-associated actin-dependent regulator of chromatin subfamily A3
MRSRNMTSLLLLTKQWLRTLKGTHPLRNRFSMSFGGELYSMKVGFARISILQGLTSAAHDIRDHKRITSKAICALDAQSRWAVTGTPIQNSLLDLASLFKFLHVHQLEDVRVFQELVNHLNATFPADAQERLKHLVRCLMLRRATDILTLPERHDLKHTLEFNAEEAELYKRAQESAVSTIDDTLLNGDDSGRQVNVLTWINSLRKICNLGTRAKLPSHSLADETWNKRTAQELFNSLVAAGMAKCRDCAMDLGVTASEVADNAAEDTHPGLTQCGYLICGPCRGRNTAGPTCGHCPAHLMVAVSSMSSELSVVPDQISSSAIPTKVKALMQDLNRHVNEEKW